MSNARPRSRAQTPRRPRRQQGATLFVALMILLLMSLLGLSVAQVVLLQERMAGNYMDDTAAFELAERALREAEVSIQDDPPACERGAFGNPAAIWQGGGEVPTLQDQVEGLTSSNSIAAKSSGLQGELPGSPDPFELGSISCLVFRVAANEQAAPDPEDPEVILQSVYILE